MNQQNSPKISLQNTNKLQSRLMLVFTALFVFCVITITFFLYNVTSMISLNNQAQDTFENTRQVYQLHTLLTRYKIGLKQYTVSASPLAEGDLSSLDKRIGETISILKTTLPEEDQASLMNLENQFKKLPGLADQVMLAVDAEDEKEEQDWDNVVALNKDADKLLANMDAEITALSQQGVRRLENVASEARTLTTLAIGSGILAFLAFLALAAIAMLIVFLQISLPMEQLTRASEDLDDGKFKPETVQKLSHRDDEIGELAREFLRMVNSIQHRKEKLTQEAVAIRAKFKH